MTTVLLNTQNLEFLKKFPVNCIPKSEVATSQKLLPLDWDSINMPRCYLHSSTNLAAFMLLRFQKQAWF